MNCNEANQYMEEYADGSLQEDMKNEITDHINKCPHCMKEYIEAKESINIIKSYYESIKIPHNLKNITIIKRRKSRIFYFKKAWISIACVFVILMGMFTIPELFFDGVSAQEYRGGFSLTPILNDKSGVNPESEFVLTSKMDINLEEIKNILTIDGEPEPLIKVSKKNEFLIIPSKPLRNNCLYTFRIKKGEDITWTYQTSSKFVITGFFPDDRTTGVPINTGIEIYFSHEDLKDVDKYFEITPFVPGIFQTKKKAVVFLPKENLKEGTIYTVKLKKGVGLKGSKQLIDKDTIFRFETVSKKPQENMVHLQYGQSLNEVMPNEKPYLPVSCSFPEFKQKIHVNTSIYVYKNIDSFIADLSKNKAYSWSYLSSQNNTLPVEGMEKVMDFNSELLKNRDDQYIKIPDNLPSGYYIVDSHYEDINFQTFLQVTNLGMYIMKAQNQTLLWINDLASHTPIEGAKIQQPESKKIYKSDNRGIVWFENEIVNKSGESQAESLYYKVKAGKMEAVLNVSSLYYSWGGNESDNYWSFLHLDRNLYKPDDTVFFWGLVKNRYQDENMDDLSMEIYENVQRINEHAWEYYGTGWKSPIADQPVVKKEIKAQDGVFKSSMELPNLDPGGYTLTLKKDDKTLVSTYLEVKEYQKPPYRLEIEKDKEAVFAGEEIKYKIKGNFFEGTPLSNLKVNYDLNLGYNCFDRQHGVTDLNGEMTVKYTPQNTGQGEDSVNIRVSSDWAEIGDVSSNASTRVFMNDINVDIQGSVKDMKGQINGLVKKITLDRLNKKTAKHYTDYLGDIVEGKTITGKIYKNTWVKVDTNQYYNPINKTTEKKYNYELKKDVYKEFTINSDSQGKFSYKFDAPDIEDGYYTGVLECCDNSGKKMTFEIYVYNSEIDYCNIYNYEENRYYLGGGKDKYSLYENVELVFKKGKEPLNGGKYLFIKTQNGIRDFEVKDNPYYSFKPQDKDLPNVNITGVYFNGITYVESEYFCVNMDYEKKNLLIEASLDKSSYRPGDEVLINVKCKDIKGNPRKAVVNASIVDEAMFKLNEQYVNTLETLYVSQPPGVLFSYQTHMNSGREMNVPNKSFCVYTANDRYVPVKFGLLSRANGINNCDFELSYDSIQLKGIQSTSIMNTTFSDEGDSSLIRQDFKDTASFKTITLDENGCGEIRITLPHNITSWRVTLSGVTTDLLGGSEKVSLDVTMPFFINYSLNDNYLIEDKPSIGVSAYGIGLKEGEAVNFKVYNKNNPEEYVTGSGKAFQRINIPLWKLHEGKGELIISAESESGLRDSLQHKINVLKTYSDIEESIYMDVKPGMKIQGSNEGTTSLTFSNKDRAVLIKQLENLKSNEGNRIDQKFPSKIAGEVLGGYFGEEGHKESFSLKEKDYQRQDGGISILPYGKGDIELSARISPLIKDNINTHGLKEFFYRSMDKKENSIYLCAILYGLSAMREPVLLELDKMSQVENLSVKDYIYLALAYCELGEFSKAHMVYRERISMHIKDYSPYMRVEVEDREERMVATALAAYLESILGIDNSYGLYLYVTFNECDDININIEKIKYLSNELKNKKNTKSSLTYSYDGREYTKDFSDGSIHTIKVPGNKLSTLSIEKVEGEVSVISTFKKPVFKKESLDNNISVKRSFTSKRDGFTKEITEFKENDIIRVEIILNIPEDYKGISYKVSDYLPSGLKRIENIYDIGKNWRYSEGEIAEEDGQNITFYVNKEWKTKRSIWYYARVISTGKYEGESTVVQNVNYKDHIYFGNSCKMSID